jgi:hypothetical protein
MKIGFNFSGQLRAGCVPLRHAATRACNQSKLNQFHGAPGAVGKEQSFSGH